MAMYMHILRMSIDYAMECLLEIASQGFPQEKIQAGCLMIFT